ncbi:UDP-4-amino-4,6-dideoxy-N-acetyl-beta-L-altrosamine transaminase [Curvivirga sp.]|uniref:UDP-4-amino-4, 6-dideoxy-N-acetyl-beta-L-altrosamine transaminase n=1 Tax=Curvivirga sp. TaxID=2856848 RepID=UPI003B5CEA15
MSDKFLPYGKPDLDDADIAEVVKVLQSDFLTTGPLVQEFEEQLCQSVSADHAVVCNSGTAALHLAYMALGLQAGDQIIVPAMTFCATANAAAMCGAEVIFADVDPTSGLVTVETLLKAISKTDPDQLKAITIVHMNGQMADMPALYQIAQSHNVKIVEDACHALGTSYEVEEQEYKVGQCAHSDYCCFSFHPVKTVAMGEGGAVTCRSAVDASLMKKLRSHGLEFEPENFTALPEDAVSNAPVWHREMNVLGYNYRAPDILCALGISQLKKLTQFKQKRCDLTAAYDAMFDGHSNLLVPIKRSVGQSVGWHLYPVLIDFKGLGKSREEVVRLLKDKNIGTQIHYTPVPHHPYWQDRVKGERFNGAEQYYLSELSLPLYSQLTTDDAQYVAETLLSILQN